MEWRDCAWFRNAHRTSVVVVAKGHRVARIGNVLVLLFPTTRAAWDVVGNALYGNGSNEATILVVTGAVVDPRTKSVRLTKRITENKDKKQL